MISRVNPEGAGLQGGQHICLKESLEVSDVRVNPQVPEGSETDFLVRDGGAPGRGGRNAEQGKGEKRNVVLAGARLSSDPTGISGVHCHRAGPSPGSVPFWVPQERGFHAAQTLLSRRAAVSCICHSRHLRDSAHQ